MTTKPQSNTEPELKPCRCGRKALIERFHDGDDPLPLFVATCEVCPVKTYDQFTADEAARVWNEFVSATVKIPDGQWQHVQIKAGNPRVVAISFETAEQATAFINSFAASPASAAPVVDEPAQKMFPPPAEDKLHIAICNAVQSDQFTASDILRQALLDYQPTKLTRTELIRVQQRSWLSGSRHGRTLKPLLHEA